MLYPNKNVYIILKNDHLWSFFNIIYTFLGSIFEPCYIQNCVITNCVIKRLKCNLREISNLICCGKNKTTSDCLLLKFLSSMLSINNVLLCEIIFLSAADVDMFCRVSFAAIFQSCNKDICMWQGSQYLQS